MRLYFKNYRDNIEVKTKDALEASVWQALEIFNNLPETDNSFLALKNSENDVLLITKYNKFVWLIELPKPEKGGCYQGFYTKNKCRNIIKDVFNELPFSEISGLSFEKYL